eukprot:7415761-Pyramimonas_sp.AAC.1
MSRESLRPTGALPRNWTQRRVSLPYSESTRSSDHVALANMRPSPKIRIVRLAPVIATFRRLASSTKP